jgi:hypothetical protein
MGADPVGQALGSHRLGIGVAGRPQHRDEDLDLPNLAGIGDRHRLPAEYHEQLLAGLA